MEAKHDHPAGEIKRLQRCINDLIGIVGLSATWNDGDPSQMVGTLLDALLGMLRLDIVSVRLKGPIDGAPLEMTRTARSMKSTARPQEIDEPFNHWLREEPKHWPAVVRNPYEDREISIVPLRVGLHDEIGRMVAASRRTDFPLETERLLLDVAANQVTIALQKAWRLGEQKRIASELDRRVAQRTGELAAANERLKQEIEERGLAEERLRREESALKRSETRKAAILDSALDCIVTIDHQGCITEFNPAAEATFGYRREEVVGKPLADVIIPPSLRDKHRQGLARRLATGEGRVLGRRVEMTAMRADGSEFPVELALARIPLDGPPSFTGYMRDITERRLSEGRWKKIIDNSAIGVAVNDLNGNFETTNAAFQKLVGFTEEELTKLRFLDITAPQFRATIQLSCPSFSAASETSSILKNNIGEATALWSGLEATYRCFPERQELPEHHGDCRRYLRAESRREFLQLTRRALPVPLSSQRRQSFPCQSRTRSTNRSRESSPTPAPVCGCWRASRPTWKGRARQRAARFGMVTAPPR